MTVASTTNKQSYNGNGTQSVFAYTFKIFVDADIKVYVGTTLKTINTHYTLSGVGTTSGGNVTFTAGNFPVAGTGNVTLLRSLALTQGVDLINYGKFDAEVVEAQYDKLTMMVQQLQEQSDRTIKFSTTVSDAGGVEITDTVAERSGKVLAYDALGDLSVANELGDWQGNWATTTTYAVRDLVLDAATNNVYTCLVGHTSGTLSTDVSASKWALVINAAAVAASAATATTKASEASTSASTASTQATNSANSATAAASSASTATTKADTATTQANTATTKASEASTSASNAATSESNASGSASAAASSAASGDAALPRAGGAMTGAITTNSTFDGVDIATRDGVLTSTTATAAAALPKAGGAMTGAITTNSTFDGVDIATRDGTSAHKNEAQTFTAGQRGEVTALTDASSIATNLALSNNYSVTLAGNRTLANPTNTVAGQSGSIFVTQDGTGSRTLAYGTNFKFVAGTAPTLSTAASSVDRIDYVVASATKIHAVASLDVK